MKYIHEPKVYLVSKPSVNWVKILEFLSDEGLPGIDRSIRAGMSDTEAIVETAARLCYMSFGRGRKDIGDFVRNLLDKGDGSVFEHVNYGFVITGISRSLSHELVRHRAGFAYSQRSQRFIDESEPSVVVPPLVDALATEGYALASSRLADLSEEVATTYARIVDTLDYVVPESDDKTGRRKAIREAARAVLPNATETKMFVTANVRAWRHFIEQRATPYADAEIRRLALRILAILEEESPLLFGDFVQCRTSEGIQVAIPEYQKV